MPAPRSLTWPIYSYTKSDIRICVLTGVRIKLSLDVDYGDETYSVEDFGILSSFEFYLGNITACLPLLSPALSELSSNIHGMASSVVNLSRTSRRRLVNSDGNTRIYTDAQSGHGSGTQALPQYNDHSYPLVQDPHLKKKGSFVNRGQISDANDHYDRTVRATTDVDVDAEPRADML